MVNDVFSPLSGGDVPILIGTGVGKVVAGFC